MLACLPPPLGTCAVCLQNKTLHVLHVELDTAVPTETPRMGPYGDNTGQAAALSATVTALCVHAG